MRCGVLLGRASGAGRLVSAVGMWLACRRTAHTLLSGSGARPVVVAGRADHRASAVAC